MKFQSLSIALMLSAGLAIGCEEAKDAASDATDAGQDAAAGVMEKTGEMVESIKTEAAEAGEAMKEAGNEAIEAGQEKVEEVMDAGKEKMDEMTGKATEMTEGAADTAKDAMSEAAESADAASSGLTLDSLKEGMSLDGSQVDGVIEKVKGLIGEKNYDTAGEWISKLEGMQLPEGYADKVSGLKDLLEKAQGAGDMLKGFGG